MDPVDEAAKEAARRQGEILTRLRNDLEAFGRGCAGAQLVFFLSTTVV